jgi:hypothetical protein
VEELKEIDSLTIFIRAVSSEAEPFPFDFCITHVSFE